jgi:hypothetical protein
MQHSPANYGGNAGIYGRSGPDGRILTLVESERGQAWFGRSSEDTLVAEIGPGWMASLLRGPIARQLAAVVAVALALLLRLALAQQSITLPTYITFYPALTFAALVGGMGAGIVATALSALIADYLLLAPVGHLTGRSISDTVGIVIVCLSGSFICVVMEIYVRNRERRAAYQTEAAILN